MTDMLLKKVYQQSFVEWSADCFELNSNVEVIYVLDLFLLSIICIIKMDFFLSLCLDGLSTMEHFYSTMFLYYTSLC